ncbi:MAG: hypothetical protein ACQGVC_24785 [Myxococcota bacterium]
MSDATRNIPGRFYGWGGDTIRREEWQKALKEVDMSTDTDAPGPPPGEGIDYDYIERLMRDRDHSDLSAIDREYTVAALADEVPGLLRRCRELEVYLETANRQLRKVDEALPRWEGTGRGRIDTIHSLLQQQPAAPSDGEVAALVRKLEAAPNSSGYALLHAQAAAALRRLAAERDEWKRSPQHCFFCREGTTMLRGGREGYGHYGHDGAFQSKCGNEEMKRMDQELASAHSWRTLAGCESFEEMYVKLATTNAAQAAELKRLRADVERLDWLERNPFDLRPMEGHDGIGWEPMEVTDPPCKRLPLRAAIDAARGADDAE